VLVVVAVAVAVVVVVVVVVEVVISLGVLCTGDEGAEVDGNRSMYVLLP